MKQRFFKHILILVASVSLLQACDKGFENMNKNPNSSLNGTIEYLFTKSQLDALATSYFFTAILNAGQAMQHFATYKEVSAAGDKYLQNDQYQAPYFQNSYITSVVEIEEAIKAAKAKTIDINKLSVARIWRVFIFHRITDLYGAVPYSEAAKGFTNTNFTPKYDAQSAIYADMLKELDEAAKAFDAAQPTVGNADLIYKGNINQWKKFAYSLMLRLGMRLTKADVNMAKNWVQKAIAGGVILNDADIAIIRYTDGPQNFNRNPVAWELRQQDYTAGANGINNIEGGKFSRTFIDQLKSKNDPRLNVWAVVYNGSTPDTATTLQQGLQNGVTARPANFNLYSEPNPNTIFRYDAPMFVLTNAETNLLLAEAVVRGMHAGSADAYYNEGVKASMRNMALYGPAGVISTARINNYLALNPFLTGGTMAAQLEQIHTQMWIALFLDEFEVFANWRRTGYPVLTPVNYHANVTGGTIPRRLRYPQIEAGINAKNYNDAVSGQGPDLLTTRVWWDK